MEADAMPSSGWAREAAAAGSLVNLQQVEDCREAVPLTLLARLSPNSAAHCPGPKVALLAEANPPSGRFGPAEPS